MGHNEPLSPNMNHVRDNPNGQSAVQPAHEATIQSGKMVTNVTGKRHSTICDATIRFQQQQDPWKHAKVDWLNVILSLITYALLVSDVPRSGAKTKFDMRPVGIGVYSFFGSYAYEVITLSRDPKSLDQVMATRYDEPLDHASTWSYTFDTTSTGIRTITYNLNATDSHALSCMNYKIHCPASGKFELADTLNMIDKVIDTVAAIPEEKIPAIYPRSPTHDEQYLRLSVHLKTRQVFIVSDMLLHGLMDLIQMRSIRVARWPNVDSTFDACADPRDRPYLCDAGPISDYRYSGDPTDEESANVTFIWNSMNDRVRAMYNQYHNATNNISIDVTVLEGYAEPLTYTGGLVLAVSSEFEIVAFIRVRDCSKDDSHGDSCRTIRLTDYRYEGGTITTDADDWNNLVSLLRITAQVYYIIRVVTLIMGCYFAFPKMNRSWARSIYMAFSEVPSHVVAYGSPFPIVLYMIALGIDDPTTNAIIHSEGMGVQGELLHNPGRLYHNICLLMRRQWLMAFFALIAVRFQVMSGQFDRHRGIVSVRGHVFGILASMSVIIGYYHPSFRDMRVLGITKENVDISVLNTRLYSRDPVNRRISGFFLDVLSIAFSAVAYVAIMLVYLFFMYFVNMCRGTTKKRGSVVQNPMETTNQKSVEVRVVGSNSFFFCRTDMLPSGCGTLWVVEGLTCGWENDVFLSTFGGDGDHKPVPTLVEFARRAMIMNIVQMSEPLNYLRLRTGFNFQKVYTYAETETQKTFNVVKKLANDPLFWKEVKTNKFQMVSKTPADELPFCDLVRCR